MSFQKHLLLTSSQNPRIKLAKKLIDRPQREKNQKFIIEGFRELSRAYSGGQPLETLFICPELFLGSQEKSLIEQFAVQGVEIFRCPEDLFRTLSYRDRPDGLVAIAPQQHLSLNELQLSSTPLLIVAEAIEKPGNLGTILRSSDAVKVDGVIVCDRCTDIHNPNVVRASVGTLFTLPVVEAGGEETLTWLRQKGISIVAATPSATQEYTQVDLRRPVAIAVGTEQYGLSKRWMEQADIQVKIPMLGIADSLNVAMATTLLLYEALRQRRMNP